MAATTDLRFRVLTPGLLGLPWDTPLAEWDPDTVDLRELPVGPSRHLVRFAQADGKLWAIKELPDRVAGREYSVLRQLEAKGLPAVRAAGLACQPEDGNALLVTRYLDSSWQFRRLLMRLPPNRPRHRARLLDAMASLLVDLHRNGVYWGDCSLANTLFSRDGQRLQAWLVDAETSEIHPELSEGQRRYDLDILVENVAGGMMDLAVMLDRPDEIHEQLIEEAAGVAPRYHALWDVLHEEPLFSFAERHEVEGRIRRLNELGFAVDEINLEPTGIGGDDRLRLKVAVAAREFHATELFELTGMQVGEGQATILLGDLHAFVATLPDLPGGLRKRVRGAVAQSQAVAQWLQRIQPLMERAHEAVHGVGNPVQAYCDLLEVRWLLSEQAGRDIGDDAALAALTDHTVPTDAAAMVVVAEADTVELARPTQEMLERIGQGPLGSADG